jgi:hypothetical protein
VKVHVRNRPPKSDAQDEGPAPALVVRKDMGFSYYNSRKSTGALAAKGRAMLSDAPRAALRLSEPSPHELSPDRGVPTKLAGPESVLVVRDRDHPLTGYRAAGRRAPISRVRAGRMVSRPSRSAVWDEVLRHKEGKPQTEQVRPLPYRPLSYEQ